MSEENLKILDLLEKGIITADEASMLMHSVRGGKKSKKTKIEDEYKKVVDVTNTAGQKVTDLYKETIKPNVKDVIRVSANKVSEISAKTTDYINVKLDKLEQKLDDKYDELEEEILLNEIDMLVDSIGETEQEVIQELEQLGATEEEAKELVGEAINELNEMLDKTMDL